MILIFISLVVRTLCLIISQLFIAIYLAKIKSIRTHTYIISVNCFLANRIITQFREIHRRYRVTDNDI